MSTYQVIFDGTPADTAFYDGLTRVEVEENVDLPDAVRLVFPVAAKDEDLTWVNDPRVKPFANVAITATPDDGTPQTIFDGYVLSHKVHLETGVTASTLDVWGQDASILMSLEDKAREFAGLTDGAVANQVFGEYGFTPAPSNTKNDSAAHTEDGHTLMQRGTDIDFLRRLARRTGRWCRVTPGPVPGTRTGTFAPPDLTAEPAVTLDLNDPVKHTVTALDFHWDVARPTEVKARQASLTDKEAVNADATESGLPPLDAQPPAAFAGRATSVMLTTTADAAELPGRAAGLLTDAGWLARCEGTADVSSLKAVLRVGTVVAVQGVGSLLSGKYLVKTVRHTITADQHSMAFTLVRNALGPSA